MRTEFVQTNSRHVVAHMCPWAVKIAKVDGGYRCFESIDDYKTWINQR